MPTASAVIVGDGPLKQAAVDFAASKGIAHRVAFTGWLPTGDDVVRTMTSARVLLMLSRSEGGPRSALEAMACGMPVIATRVGVMPEVIEDGVNGILTDGSIGDLQKKLDPLLTNEGERLRLGHAAARIAEKFEKQKLLREYAEFLKGLANC